MLPNLIVIGAAKCGTTSLHEYLNEHPEISMSSEKELYFFVEEKNLGKGLAWYESQFDPSAPVRGESSPGYSAFPLYRGVALVTPNQLETEQVTGIRIRTEDDLLAAGARILRKLRCGAALVTRGEQGMSLFEEGRRPVHIPTSAREVFDVTGAGDTVIATVALGLCGGARLHEAAMLANYAAGVVVAKLGTATATPDEVIGAVEAGAAS